MCLYVEYVKYLEIWVGPAPNSKYAPISELCLIMSDYGSVLDQGLIALCIVPILDYNCNYWQPAPPNLMML